MPLQKRIANFSIAILSVWLVMAIYALLQGVSGLLTINNYEFLPWEELQRNTIYVWMPLLPLTPLVFWSASRFPVVPRQLRVSLTNHFFLMCIFSLLHGYLSALLYFHIGNVTDDMVGYDAWQHAGHILFENDVILLDVFIYSMLVASLHINMFYKLAQRKELDAIRLHNQLIESRLQTLKLQLNPHFLFNTLNGIAVLIDKCENEKARKMLNQLSSFLRHTLNNLQDKWVTVESEMDMVRQYLRIEQYRFGSRLTYSEECEPIAREAHIPSMLLQPLFENAIVHGLSQKQGPCRLSFECRLYDRYLLIFLFDNGGNFNGQQNPFSKGGVGLGNTQARLIQIYGNNHKLKIESKSDGTLVTLKIPSYKDSQF